MQHIIYLSIFIIEIRVENLRPSVVGTFASLADVEENFCYSSQKLIVGFTQCEGRGRGTVERGEGGLAGGGHWQLRGSFLARLRFAINALV